MTLPTAPSRTMDQDTFDAATDAFIGALPQFETDMNAASASASASASSATSSATSATTSANNASTSATQSATSAATASALVAASDWVSGGTYSVGNIRISPSNRRLYKCIQAAVGRTTDPSTDTAYWLPSLFDSNIGDAKFAAISTSLPSLSYVDACMHLAKDDTDKGAWRKRKGQSWRSEARSAGKYLGVYASNAAAVTAGGLVGDYYFNSTNSKFAELTDLTGGGVWTYRGGREDYPTNALITGDDLGATGRIIIWDLDGAIPSMWMVFGPFTSATWATAAPMINADMSGANSFTLAVNNEKLVVGSTSNGVYVVDFVSDEGYGYRTSSAQGKGVFNGNISTRNSALGYMTVSAISQLVSDTINDVATTILPDAPVDEYGMPVPTIYVFTAGGVSRIASDGTVSSTATGSSVSTGYVGGDYVFADRLSAGYLASYATSSALPTGGASNLGAYWNIFTATTYSAGVQVPVTLATGPTMRISQDAVGNNAGLTRYKFNPADRSKSLVAAITSTYNTGWMVGDIRRCFLANSKTADRSIKAGTLVEVGTITETVNAGGRNVYSGFSGANYLREASHADWNALGTGDFSIIMSGIKWGTNGATRYMFTNGDFATQGSIALFLTTGNLLRFSVWDATPAQVNVATSTATFTDTAEHVVEVKRSGTTVSILVDGAIVATGTSSLTISNAASGIGIGASYTGLSPWQGGQCSCVRISATAPTAEQSKFIAATENALNGGNACLLSNSSSVSALAYDKDTDTYRVGNGTNVDTFNGLKRITSAAHGVTTLTALAGGNGRALTAGTGATYTAPERNVSAELLESQVIQQKTVFKQITSDGSGKLSFPQGMKPVRIDSTAGTYVSLATSAPTYDGFIWSVSGLSASTAYDCELVRE